MCFWSTALYVLKRNYICRLHYSCDKSQTLCPMCSLHLICALYDVIYILKILIGKCHTLLKNVLVLNVEQR